MNLLRRVDNEVQESHQQDTEQIKYDSKFKFRVHKSPAYQLQSSLSSKTSEVPTGMPLPITSYMPLDTSAGLISIPLVGKNLDTISDPPQYSEYWVTQENFAKSRRA